MNNSNVNMFAGSKKSSGKILMFIKILIAVLLIVYLINHLNPVQIWKDFNSANVFALSIATLLLIPNIYFQFKKWELLCNSILKETDKRKIFYSLFYGFSAGISTPMRLGEYLGRAIPFKKNNTVELTIATFIDKLFPILIVLFLGSAASIVFIYNFYNVSFFITSLLFVVLFIALYLLIMIFNDSDFWKNYIYKMMGKVKFLSKYAEQFASINKLDSTTIRKITLISVFFYITYITQFSILVFAFNNSSQFLIYAWIAVMVMFSKKFISFISIGDLGIREATAVYFASILGVPEVSAFNASVFIFLINLVIPSVVGLLFILKRN